MLQENWVGRVGVVSHQGRVTSQYLGSGPQFVPVNVHCSVKTYTSEFYRGENFTFLNFPVVLMAESDDRRRGRSEFVKAEICQFDYKPRMFNLKVNTNDCFQNY